MDILVFLGWIVFAVVVGGYADRRGRSGAGWGFLALLISPLIAFIILLVIPDIAAQERAEEREREEREQADAQAARVSAMEARRINGADMALRFEKLQQLRERGLLTEPEYDARKQKVFDELEGKQLVESSEDFLSHFLPLIDSGVLTPDETTRLKAFAFHE